LTGVPKFYEMKTAADESPETQEFEGAREGRAARGQ
jgi:hypothetical protein